MKRGSALLMALFIIAVLSIMVMSFAYEAHQEAGINVYLRERNRTNRLIEPGRILGETILLGYTDAKEWSEDEKPKDLDEDDRFYLEKRALKFDTRCTIGPILLDEDDPDSGIVTVDIEMANSGSENGININELYAGGDSNWSLRWQMILKASGIDEELEVEAPESDGTGTKRHNLMNLLLASWNDWRDEDDTVSKGPLSDNEPEEDDGAESKWYEESDEAAEKEAHGRDEREAIKEDRRRPRNGSIPDMKELQYVRGFRDFPSVLTGGLLYSKLKPDEKESEDNPRLKGISGIFGTSGSSKVVINLETTVDQLMTIPGIFPEGSGGELDADDEADSKEVAQAILDGLKIMPENRDDVDETRDWWPYKDWNDLTERFEDNYKGNLKLGEEVQNYIEFAPSDTTVFKMKITGESGGMKREVNCKCYVKDKKVRYIEWRED